MKTGKLLLATAVTSLLTLTLSAPVMANGTGDLYVASQAGVLEVLVKSSSVINTIPMLPVPQALAFSPDGRTLFAGNGGKNVVPIDIATLDVQSPIVMPGAVSSLAFPAGQLLVASMPTRRTLAWAVVHGGAVKESAPLPGPGNLLAGDPRDARVAVAEAGKSWLDIVDPAAQTLNKVTVVGGIVAMAIDRDRGDVMVATQNPNSIVRIDLTSHLLSWTLALPAAPVAVASLDSTIVVGGGSRLWKVNGKIVTEIATTKQPVVSLTATYDGAYVYAGESNQIEAFDETGSLQRTVALTGDDAPVAMASIPSGSSLFLGRGSSPTGTPGPKGTMPGGLATPNPPTTSTVTDTARDIAGYPPFQDAVVVGFVILVLCGLVIRWYDRRTARPR